MENKPEHFHQGLWWPLILICGWVGRSSLLPTESEVTETQRQPEVTDGGRVLHLRSKTQPCLTPGWMGPNIVPV